MVWPEITPADARQEPEVANGWGAQPYLDPRDPPSSPVTKRVESDALAAPVEKPAGRILLDLNEASAPVEAEPVDDKLPKPARRARRPKASVPPESVANEIEVAPLPEIDTKAIAATIVLRQGRNRLSRDDFKRGDRWRARLPMSVHRVEKRRTRGS